MGDVITLRAGPGVVFSERTDGGLLFESPGSMLEIPGASPALRAALRELAGSGATETALADRVLEAEGPAALPRLHLALLRLGAARLLSYEVRLDGQPLLALRASSRAFAPPDFQVDRSRRYQLSRFACMRRRGSEWVLESPLAHGELVLQDWRAQVLVSLLSAPRSVDELVTALPGLNETTSLGLLALLCGCGLAGELDAAGQLDEERSLTLRQWSFHDLLFHARSRRGRHAQPSGATERFRGQLEPLPALKPRMSDQVMALHRPELEQVQREDPPFTRVLEERRSIRDYRGRVLTSRMVGEFLYRACRVKERYGREENELTRRPYPSAGAGYALEVYLASGRCDGLEPGLYHYAPEAHELHRLPAQADEVEWLLQEARHSAAQREPPQLLIILSARFSRLFWRYESIGYALLLKDVGVLLQTMYLVATAMGLAPCALGSGDSDCFARAAGLDYRAESSVGEFLLGGALEASVVPPDMRGTP
ncbi:MAG: SagB family peptide dehydrogenase [Myxococcaceae bacterium]|nr:SagB family peptide dehydrogenase [Myxococcaceae bacterium]